MGERYFLSQDNDCHWYIVPVAKRSEWEAWQSLDEDDEKSWEPPRFAAPVGGSPSIITFENYQDVD